MMQVPPKTKLLFFIPTLTGGGAEKALLQLVNNLPHNDYDITVKTLLNEGIYINKLKEAVKYKSIIKANNQFLKKTLSYVIQFLIPPTIVHRLFVGNGYDIEVGYLEGFPIKLISASNNPHSRKLGWIHIDTYTNRDAEKVYGSLEKAKALFSKLDGLFFVSESCKEAFIKRYGLTKRLHIQYNVLEDQEIKAKALEEQYEIEHKSNETILISIGRLTEQKGFKRLIAVAKKLLIENHRIKLFILGEGPQRQELEKTIAELHLNDYIRLLGFKENPYPYIAAADAFVCSSNAEGFSTAATEAIILGKPVVTTDCAGMKELLGEQNEFGIVADNTEEGLYEGLKTLLIGNLTTYAKAAKDRGSCFTKGKRIEEYRRIFNVSNGIYH